MLPGLDGMRVCELLRRESDVPIVMLTARVQDEEKLAGLECGADDYITKPFNPRRWSRASERCCGASSARCALTRACAWARFSLIPSSARH